jgi:dihydroorotate dehydrogenase
MNASGCHCKTKTHLDNLVTIGLTTIITKTCTLYPNNGNRDPCFNEVNNNISINCLGMPNPGYTYYKELLLEYIKKNITYIISIDASNQEELNIMLQDYDSYISILKNNGVLPITNNEYIEINVSCPNKLIIETGKTSRIISYDILQFTRILENIKNLELANIQIGIKLSPYVDKVLLEQIANIIIKYRISARIKYIVCGNCIPNGMIIDNITCQPILSVKTGGISGIVNKLISVSNVYQFNNIFKKNNIDIIIVGCGGIETSDDVLEYLNAGAHSVQVGRALYLNGVDKLVEINKSLLSKL